MENKSHALAAGLFTLLLGVSMLAAVLWFSGDAVKTKDYLLVSHYPVTGLNIQAPVRYRGVDVGKVTGIKFDPQDPRAILIEVSVQTDARLTKSVFAQLGSQGVTGLSYVMLDDEGNSNELLTSDGNKLARIDVKQSFMDSVTASGQDVLNNVNRVAQNLNVLLGEQNQKQLLSTLRNLDQVSGKVNTLVTDLDPVVKVMPGVMKDAVAVLQHTDTLLTNVNQRVASFERAALGAERLTASGSALSDAMLNDSLPRLNGLLDDLQRSSRDLEHVLQQVEDQPHSFIFGKNPSPPGPGEPGFAAQRSSK